MRVSLTETSYTTRCERDFSVVSKTDVISGLGVSTSKYDG